MNVPLGKSVNELILLCHPQILLQSSPILGRSNSLRPTDDCITNVNPVLVYHRSRIQHTQNTYGVWFSKYTHCCAHSWRCANDSLQLDTTEQSVLLPDMRHLEPDERLPPKPNLSYSTLIAESAGLLICMWSGVWSICHCQSAIFNFVRQTNICPFERPSWLNGSCRMFGESF